MDSIEDLKEPAVHGLVSLVISVVATFAVAQVIPTTDLAWALYAVAYAGFFSGFFAAM